MRACILVPLGAALLAAAPAGASVITVGGSHATTCWRAAETRRPDADAWTACNIALATETLSPQDRAGTFVNRGILHMLSQRWDRAAADFAQAERIDPAQAEIYVNQAVVAYEQSDPANARLLATKALGLGTRKPAVAHFVRGVANEDLGQVRAAYADLSEAARLAPRWSEPKRELARYRLR
ncbi:hypothetical protein [Sphingomonas sp. LHG3406-1]|uniref:tetratricopeptide repeat protein n=1 Tax=Sphingomonas sp. LHG3406-1 TaxID=2804617 RepID=UPI0026205DD9|nr:hypothetical protein [Sphingomonas sp. LHG3406-1]